MDQITLGTWTFFEIILSGFVTVWTFRYVTGSKKSGDFEYLAMSAFWGMVNIMLFELTVSADKVAKDLANPYAAGTALGITWGVFIGFIGGKLTLSKRFQKILKKIHIK